MKTYDLFDMSGNWLCAVRAKTIRGAVKTLTVPRYGTYMFRWIIGGQEYVRAVNLH